MSFKDALKAAVKEASDYDGIPNIIDEIDGVEIVECEITGSGRWANYHTMVVNYGNEYWEVDYASPATENQDWDNEYSIVEVEPVEVKVIQYRRKK